MKTVFLLVMIAIGPNNGLLTNSNYWFKSMAMCEESAEIAYQRFGGHTHKCIRVDIPIKEELDT